MTPEPKRKARVKKMTLGKIKNILLKNDKNLHGTDFKIAQFLLSSLFIGANKTKLRKFCRLKQWEADLFFHRATSNGIFTKDGKINAAWKSKKYGGIAFYADCAVISGFLKRV